MTATVDPSALRDARQRAGLTQSQLARALGLAGGEAVSVWERGVFEPKTAALLHLLAEALGVGVPELLQRDGDKLDLRYLRLVAGMESSEVALRLHVALSTYLRWERGAWTRRPSDAVVANLAQLFRVSPAVVEGAFVHAKALGSLDKT